MSSWGQIMAAVREAKQAGDVISVDAIEGKAVTVVDLHLVVPSGDWDRTDQTGVMRYAIPGSKFMPLAVGAAQPARVEFDPYGETHVPGVPHGAEPVPAFR